MESCILCILCISLRRFPGLARGKKDKVDAFATSNEAERNSRVIPQRRRSLKSKGFQRARAEGRKHFLGKESDEGRSIFCRRRGEKCLLGEENPCQFSSQLIKTLATSHISLRPSPIPVRLDANWRASNASREKVHCECDAISHLGEEKSAFCLTHRIKLFQLCIIRPSDAAPISISP